MFFKKQAKYKSLVLAAFAFSAVAEARPARPFYQAGRALAMGDAYTAVGTDFEAVYYNPAGIARRIRPRFKVLDLEMMASQSLLSIFDGSVMKFMSLGQILSDVENNPGKPYGIGMAVLPQFLIRNFSVGALFRGQTEATYNEDDQEIDMFSYADLGVYVHYGVALAGGIVKLGVGGKVINRAELDKTYTQAQFSSASLNFSDEWKEGWGYGLDVGALLTLPVVGLPTFGLTIQDLGHTQFFDQRIFFTSDSAPAGAPKQIAQRVNAGFSFIVKHGRGNRSVFALDYKDLLNASYSSVSEIFDNFHAGWELNMQNLFYLRAGVNQGRYWTAGLGIDVRGVGIEFASYGENLAAQGEERRSDRKYVGRYVLSF